MSFKSISLIFGLYTLAIMVTPYLPILVPASIIALLALFLLLLKQPKLVNDELIATSKFLQAHLGLFLIPAGVGVGHYFHLIKEQIVILICVLIINALFTMFAALYFFKWFKGAEHD